VGGTFQQGIEVRIIRGFGIGAEDGGRHLDVHCGADIRQTAPALTLHFSPQASAPEVFAVTGRLQLAVDRDGAHQMQIQTLESGVVGLQLPNCSHRASMKVPDIHSQHSRLN
jgi:hypothetical protein